MFLFLFVPFIHCIETLILFILDLTRQKGTTEELIREIEQKLKHTSQATGAVVVVSFASSALLKVYEKKIGVSFLTL